MQARRVAATPQRTSEKLLIMVYLTLKVLQIAAIQVQEQAVITPEIVEQAEALRRR